MNKNNADNAYNHTLFEVLERKHICLFYDSKQDLLDLLIPYFKAGIESNAFCVWITTEQLGVEGAKEALGKAVKDLDSCIEKGQLEIIDYKNWYLRSGKFNSGEVLKGWAEKEKLAKQRGFHKLRVSGDMSWLSKGDWNAWVAYEKEVDEVVDRSEMTALCTYTLANHDVVEMFILSNHHRIAFSNKNRQWHILKNVKLNNLLENIKYFLDDYGNGTPGDKSPPQSKGTV